MTQPPFELLAAEALPARHLRLVWSAPKAPAQPVASAARAAEGASPRPHLRLIPPPPASPAASAGRSRASLALNVAFVVACLLILGAVCRAVALETAGSVASEIARSAD